MAQGQCNFTMPTIVRRKTNTFVFWILLHTTTALSMTKKKKENQDLKLVQILNNALTLCIKTKPH